jgi:hypothetical protein
VKATAEYMRGELSPSPHVSLIVLFTVGEPASKQLPLRADLI